MIKNGTEEVISSSRRTVFYRVLLPLILLFLLPPPMSSGGPRYLRANQQGYPGDEIKSYLVDYDSLLLEIGS